MCKRCYKINMQTPMGIKCGTISVMIEKGRVKGNLNVMNHKNPLLGFIDEEGNCKLTGSIVTLMQTVSYEAYGKIEEDKISLTIYGGRNVFQMVGEKSMEDEIQLEMRI